MKTNAKTPAPSLKELMVKRKSKAEPKKMEVQDTETISQSTPEPIEAKKTKKPISLNLDEDLNNILCLWRESYYAKTTDRVNDSELIRAAIWHMRDIETTHLLALIEDLKTSGKPVYRTSVILDSRFYQLLSEWRSEYMSAKKRQIDDAALVKTAFLHGKTISGETLVQIVKGNKKV
jgi:hypothetical protein